MTLTPSEQEWKAQYAEVILDEPPRPPVRWWTHVLDGVFVITLFIGVPFFFYGLGVGIALHVLR